MYDVHMPEEMTDEEELQALYQQLNDVTRECNVLRDENARMRAEIKQMLGPSTMARERKGP